MKQFTKASSLIRLAFYAVTRLLLNDVFSVFIGEKSLVFVASDHTGLKLKSIHKTFDFSNPKAFDKESKTGFTAGPPNMVKYFPAKFVPATHIDT